MSPIDLVLQQLEQFSVRRMGRGWRSTCAHCGRRGTLTIAEGVDGAVLINCFAKCEPEQLVAALGLTMADLFVPRQKGAGPTRPRPEPPSTRMAEACDGWKTKRSAEIWLDARQITTGCMVEPYFAARCVPLPPMDGDLRWLPDLHLFGFSGPVLVGRMSPAADYREHRGLHLTWLRNGPEGWRRHERRYLGPKKGCVVRLWPEEAITAGLAVAEGIETALAVAHAYTPVWACMDAGNLAEFPVLPGIESLLIAADHDDAGIKASDACGARWAAAGREVRIVMPREHKTDVNDLVAAA